MTSTALHAHTDAELLDRAEQGDESAFTALYRRHYAATRRLAYTYLLHGSPDDLVDATFGEVVDGLRAHRRPADSFGLHLFATLRRLAGQRPDDTPPGVSGEVPAAVAAVAGRQTLGGTDRSTITQAFSALGERWQVVVWHTLVDGCDATELSYRLGVSPHAAAVQAQRAESKLRQAYLDAHLRVAPRPACHPHRERLAAMHRRALGGADAAGHPRPPRPLRFVRQPGGRLRPPRRAPGLGRRPALSVRRRAGPCRCPAGDRLQRAGRRRPRPGRRPPAVPLRLWRRPPAHGPVAQPRPRAAQHRRPADRALRRSRRRRRAPAALRHHRRGRHSRPAAHRRVGRRV